jgi:hypothetical protein
VRVIPRSNLCPRHRAWCRLDQAASEPGHAPELAQVLLVESIGLLHAPSSLRAAPRSHCRSKRGHGDRGSGADPRRYWRGAKKKPKARMLSRAPPKPACRASWFMIASNASIVPCHSARNRGKTRSRNSRSATSSAKREAIAMSLFASTDPQSLSLYRPAQPHADRIVKALSRRRC